MNVLKYLLIALLSSSPTILTIGNKGFSGINEAVSVAFDTAVKDFDKQTKRLTIGDNVTINGIKMTLNSVELTDERNQFEEPTENVMVVNYELENTTSEDYLYGWELSVYVNNRLVDLYALDNSIGTLSAGRVVEATQYFGYNDTADSIEIEFRPDQTVEDYAVFYVDKASDEDKSEESADSSESKEDDTKKDESNSVESTPPPTSESSWVPPVESKPEESTWTPPENSWEPPSSSLPEESSSDETGSEPTPDPEPTPEPPAESLPEIPESLPASETDLVGE